MQIQFICLLLLVFCTFAFGIVPTKPLQWYSSGSVLAFDPAIIESVDFRGCYEIECIYVATEPLFGDDKVLGLYLNQGVWVMADYNNTLTWVFSEEAPVEPGPMRWVFKITEKRIKPISFNAEKYRRDAPDPLVARLVNYISAARIEETVYYLSDTFHTRNSYADLTLVVEFLERRLTVLGCEKVRNEEFRTNWAPNIFCEIPGTDSTLPMVYVGGHYDSRGSIRDSTTQRAPGADDNGSGTAGVLEILRAISENGATFRRTISIALWAGEEQGLVGSRYEAAQLSDAGVEIDGYINLDMIGYPNSAAPTTLYWSTNGVDRPLTDFGVELTYTYLGDDTLIGYSTGCCSDQQSFVENGYRAVSVFESTAASRNPNYHQSTDLPPTVNYNHARRITQMAAALLLTLAEPVS